MNETDLIQAINGIDDRYLSESEEPYKKPGMIRNPYGLMILAAAILVIAIPTGVFAIRNSLHGDNVEHVEHHASGMDAFSRNNPDAKKYLMAEKDLTLLSLEEWITRKKPNVIKDLAAENDDYHLTVDALLSDGHSVMILLTSEAISEFGKEHLKKYEIGKNTGCYRPSFCIKYADGSGGPSHYSPVVKADFPVVETSVTIYDHAEEANARDIIRSLSIVDCRRLDLSKDVKLEFFANDNPFYDTRYFENKDPILAERFPDEFAASIENYLDGIEFTVSFEPNVTCNTLYDAEGRQVFLSAFELFSNDPDVIVGLPDVTFIKNSGERLRLQTKNGKVRGSRGLDTKTQKVAFSRLVFGDFIDPNEYAGVEVNGMEFWKK